MANKGFFLLFFLACFQAYGQYIPMVRENKYWIFNHYYNNDKSNVDSGFLIQFKEDTLLDNKSYKKVYRQELSGTEPCPPSQRPCFSFDLPYHSIGQTLIGFIRENEAEQKVYFKSVSGDYCNEAEYLLFDFFLAPDSALDTCKKEALGGQAGFGIIDSISLEFYYGKMRKTQHTFGYITYIGLPPIGVVNIIEGIGFERFGPFHEVGNRNELYDFCEGNSPENCGILSGVKAAVNTPRLLLYPNPASEFIRILLPAEIRKTGTYRILNCSGQLIREGEIPEGAGEYSMRVSTLPAGMYFIETEGIFGHFIKN